jgi:predicted LPLAT superfamily acyltransferase
MTAASDSPLHAGRPTQQGTAQAWLERPEGGTLFGYKLIATFATICGRAAARLVLYPITAYFLLRRGPERRASRTYLQRVKGRKPTLWEIASHVHCFAAVTLDRVFLLSERFRRFQTTIYGLDDLRAAWAGQRGVLIFGAHLGSFEALRVLAQVREDVKVRVVIDVEQNPTLSRTLNALNPALARSIISARQDGATIALAIKEALDDKSLVTMLVDRSRPGNQLVSVDFLGQPASFATAPWQLAAALKVPVLLCFGLYRGGNRYDLHFERFADPLLIERADRQAALRRIVQRFADRLAHHARSAPYNWFNFYDFWRNDVPQDSAVPGRSAEPAERPGRGT